MTLAPEGWYVEGPDESVGIFGTLVLHEVCGTEQEAAIARVERHEQLETQTETITDVWVCPTCGAELRDETSQPMDLDVIQ